LVELTDGDGIGDGNNTITMGSFKFGGGSPLGGAILYGGASGSLETGLAITASSFVSLFIEEFASGLQLSFSLTCSSNNDASETPDRLVVLILDSSGIPLPTLAPSGDYFLGADLRSRHPVFDLWGSDPTRAPSVGNPIALVAPTLTPLISHRGTASPRDDNAVCPAGFKGTGANYDPSSESCVDGAVVALVPAVGDEVCLAGAYGLGGFYDPTEEYCYDGAFVSVGESFCPAGGGGGGGSYDPSTDDCDGGKIKPRKQ